MVAELSLHRETIAHELIAWEMFQKPSPLKTWTITLKMSVLRACSTRIRMILNFSSQILNFSPWI